MSKKAKIIWVCSNCGGEHLEWAGKCNYCNEWNCLKQISETESAVHSEEVNKTKIQDILTDDKERIKTSISEFDLVLGGGIVRGAVILLGGQPGIGKSTLVWQIASSIKGEVCYIAGEESPGQIKLRATRLKQASSNVTIYENQDITAILPDIKKSAPELLIVDSIQTVFDPTVGGSAGSLVQVRESALKIINFAKKNGIAVILIGHVTKDGEVAGPKTLEHLVDAVFYLEGGEGNERYLRSSKNRFGPTDEIGIFTMNEEGLKSEPNFGAIKPDKKLPEGVSRVAILEGSRVIFLEIQALTQKNQYGFPKRNCVGFDLNRLQMIIAVLAKHGKINLLEHDVYLNVSGGYKVKDPICDLAAMIALAGSTYESQIAGDKIFLGEVDLAGMLHLPSEAKRIIKTADKLGFQVIYGQDHVEKILRANLVSGKASRKT
jgi:DNA repair protein RadA/Sms